MNKPIVSIIVPVYNAEKYVGRCIESILTQTYDNIQLVIVNDGSIDASKEIIDGFSNDTRVYIVQKENTGVSDTRNIGIETSVGEYIGFVDADDYIEFDMVEKMVAAIENKNADVCCCGYVKEFSDFRYEIQIDEEKVLTGVKEICSWYLRQDIRNGIFDGNWNKIFKRSAISDIRYKNIEHCEDVDFQLRVFENCSRIVCIPNMLYHHISNNESATNSVFSEKKLSVLCVADEVLNTILDKYPDIDKEAYAFHLTWYLSVVQDMFDTSNTGLKKNNVKSIELRVSTLKWIKNNLKKNYNNYYKNPYSKRLDQFYLVATVLGITKLAIEFRKIVRSILPSKDKKEKE